MMPAYRRLLFTWMENNDLTMKEFSISVDFHPYRADEIKRSGTPTMCLSGPLEAPCCRTDLRIEEILTFQPEDQETD